MLLLLLDEEHGDVLDNVHHGLLEVRERVFDIIFAFLVKNWGINMCHTSYFSLFVIFLFFSCMNQAKIMHFSGSKHLFMTNFNF